MNREKKRGVIYIVFVLIACNANDVNIICAQYGNVCMRGITSKLRKNGCCWKKKQKKNCMYEINIVEEKCV